MSRDFYKGPLRALRELQFKFRMENQQQFRVFIYCADTLGGAEGEVGGKGGGGVVGSARVGASNFT